MKALLAELNFNAYTILEKIHFPKGPFR